MIPYILRFEQGENFFELVPIEADDPGPYAEGDLHFDVRAQGSTFQGFSKTWCDEPSLIRFCRDLSAMNRTLAGEAVLSSMSPNELQLKISDLDGRGHFLLTASIGMHHYGDPHYYWNALQVQFAFDQTLLQTAMSLSWVRAYAAKECR